MSKPKLIKLPSLYNIHLSYLHPVFHENSFDRGIHSLSAFQLLLFFFKKNLKKCIWDLMQSVSLCAFKKIKMHHFEIWNRKIILK